MRIVKWILLLMFLISLILFSSALGPGLKADHSNQSKPNNNAFNAEKLIEKNHGLPLVVIDAGHGGTEKGAPEESIKEKDLNLAIALKLQQLLEKNHINVIMTRTDDSHVSLYERVLIANQSQADLFISIHNNWFPDKTMRGTMTLYYTYYKDNPAGSFNSKKFAAMLNHEMVKELDTNNLGIIPRHDLVVLKYTSMPAVLVEVACLSNRQDRHLTGRKDFVDKTAYSIYNGLLKAIKEIKKSNY